MFSKGKCTVLNRFLSICLRLGVVKMNTILPGHLRSCSESTCAKSFYVYIGINHFSLSFSIKREEKISTGH